MKGPTVWPRETSRATAAVTAECRERADSRLRGRVAVTGRRYPSGNPNIGTGPGPAGGAPAEGRGADERSRVSEAPPAPSPPPPPPPRQAKWAVLLVIEVDRKPQGVGHRIVCSSVRISRRPACTTGRCSPGRGRRAAPNQLKETHQPPCHFMY